MNYFIIEPDFENYAVVGPVNEADIRVVIDHIDDPRPFVNWHPFKVETVDADEGAMKDWCGRDDHNFKAKPLADLMDFNLTSINVLSARAKEALSRFLDESGELLPVELNGEKYYINHVTKVLPALDLNKSEVEKFSSGEIMRVLKYVLKEKVVGKADIFKLTGVNWLVFASERFVNVVKETGLLGFKFVPIEVSQNP